MNIKIMKSIFSDNQNLANENRVYFNENNLSVINVLASPGAGKTSTIMELIKCFSSYNIGVIEGDIASSIDAEKISKMGVKSVEINTDGACHLNAISILEATKNLSISNGIVFIENIGNLVCPSEFDLGEKLKLLIASVPEGDDKPYKYISIFQKADIIALNKWDLESVVEFDYAYFERGVKAINPKAEIIKISCKNKLGLEYLANSIKEYTKNTYESK